MSTLLKMQKIHPLCSRCIGMYPLQNRWTVLRYLQCYENFSECCTHLILPETALFSPTPTFAKEPKLYLCSFCIHPAYNTTNAFRIIYSNFIDFLLKLASEHEIFISDIIADGVTQKGSNLCESIGMTKVAKSIHNSDVYEACLIPPSLTTIKLNNRIGQQLLAYYKQMYNNYKEIF